MKLAWERLIRSIAEDRGIYYSEPVLDSAEDLNRQAVEGTLVARTVKGDIFDDTTALVAEPVEVVKLLSPLSSRNVSIIWCVGLNYLEHGMLLTKTLNL